MTETRAEIRLPTQELRNDLPFYTKVLKMRLDMIYPADNPEVAVLSGHGLRPSQSTDFAAARYVRSIGFIATLPSGAETKP